MIDSGGVGFLPLGNPQNKKQSKRKISDLDQLINLIAKQQYTALHFTNVVWDLINPTLVWEADWWADWSFPSTLEAFSSKFLANWIDLLSSTRTFSCWWKGQCCQGTRGYRQGHFQGVWSVAGGKKQQKLKSTAAGAKTCLSASFTLLVQFWNLAIFKTMGSRQKRQNESPKRNPWREHEWLKSAWL